MELEKAKLLLIMKMEMLNTKVFMIMARNVVFGSSMMKTEI
jgi:hypothetical protein